MSFEQARDTVIVVAIFTLFFLLVRWTRAAPVIPPAVTPVARPLEEEVREIRHRLANVEQRFIAFDRMSERLGDLEREVAEVRGTLGGVAEGQVRIARQLDKLVDHHIDREKQA